MENKVNVDEESIVTKTYNTLKEKCLAYLEPSSEEIIYKAFRFAHNFHAEQKRKSGEPYIIHPLEVAIILSEFFMDETSIVAAILHDVVEDTHVSVQEVEKEFGQGVSALVDGLTKLSKIHFRSNQEKMAENFRKMIIAMSKDIRVIIVKLADRTHNMRTIRALPEDKRHRIAEETLEIYAAIAGRLGIHRIKAELEDLSIRELKPSVYYSLTTKVAHKRIEREKIIETAKNQLVEKLNEAKIQANVQGRAKHFYSIYKKMSEKKIEFEDIYDLFALRILVSTVNECYETLGIIHNIYKPVPGRFKDFIALPKANLYQSLHTTVVATKGELLEIQIRTHQMHNIAENGIAAHWVYKENRNRPQGQSTHSSRPDIEKFTWLKQMVSHQKEITDPNEFLEAVKVDLFDEEVYVFSPKGDVFELRKGATCLDFAFEIHTDLGLRTTGAKVNGRIASIRSRLFSGDVVELIVGHKIRANKDWLNFTTTSKARNKIRGHLRTEERISAKNLGLELLESELAKYGTNIDKCQKAGFFQDLSKILSVSGLDDFLLQIGYLKLDPKIAVSKIAQAVQLQKTDEATQESPKNVQEELEQSTFEHDIINKIRPPTSKRNKQDDIVTVQGMKDVLVRMARCCEPLPGQPIVGFVSRSRGIIVHAATCPWALSIDPGRRVSCSWNNASTSIHNVRVRITAHDQPGILAAITKMVSTSQINISGMECFTNSQRRAVILLKLELLDIRQMKDIHQKIEAIDGVIHVERSVG